MPDKRLRELVTARLVALESSPSVSSASTALARRTAAHLARIQGDGERVIEALVATQAIHEHASRRVFITLSELAAVAGEEQGQETSTQEIAALAGQYVLGVRAVCRAASGAINQALRADQEE